MSTAQTEVMTPITRPALRYFGGKWLLAPWILQHMPEHKTYVEPFAGAASVLLRKAPARNEVLNDRSGHIVNFFRVVREHTFDLVELLEMTPYAIDEFVACEDLTSDDIENARRYFVRSWMGFGGGTRPSGTGRGFRRSAHNGLAPAFLGAIENLYAVAERLRNVTIENFDWSQAFDKYDSRHTVFYVDPPYLHRVRSEGRYDKGYGEFELDTESHLRLLDRCCSAKGAVVLSGYADPLYDLRLAGWKRVECDVSTVQNRARSEVLWVRGAA